MADATVGVHWVQGIGQSIPWSPPGASPRIEYVFYYDRNSTTSIDAGAPAAHYFSLCERKKSNQKKVAQLNHPAGSLTAVDQSGGLKNSSSFASLFAYSDRFIPKSPDESSLFCGFTWGSNSENRYPFSIKFDGLPRPDFTTLAFLYLSIYQRVTTGNTNLRFTATGTPAHNF
jgi:hypothetical protein